jgi:hypothetical protein
MNGWLIGAVGMIAALELSYLLIINLILNLAATQVLINRLNPYPSSLNWRRAWSLYPFRIHLRGIAANGQDPSGRWHGSTPAASGTIRIWPLLERTLSVRKMRLADVEFHGHHRPGPDPNGAETGPIWPVVAADGTSSSAFFADSRWKIELFDVRATGVHRIQIAQTQGVFEGHLDADVSAVTPGGPLVLSGGGFDATLKVRRVDANRDIIRQGRLAGTLSTSPLLPGQHTGRKVLASLTLDAHLSCEAGSLAFFNPLVNDFYGMRVDGAGSLEGRVRLKNATLQPNSRLFLAARQLSVNVLAHRIQGVGSVRIAVDPQAPQATRVSLVFESVKTFAAGSHQALFVGEGLAVSGKGPVAWAPKNAPGPMAGDLSVTLSSVRVPDLCRCQRYLPGHWPVTLHGGQGALQAMVQWSGSTLTASLTLASQNTDIGIKGYRFNGNLDVAVHANSAALVSAGIDLSGTRIALDNARLANRDRADALPWHASLEVENGLIHLHAPDTQDNRGIGQWIGDRFGRNSLANLTTGAQALKLTGHLSDLRWLTLLLSTPYRLAVHGAGEMRAEVHLASGRLADGTVLTIRPSQLRVDVLDYMVEGDGQVTPEVTTGGKDPDLNLAATLEKAYLKRRDETRAFIDQVGIRLQATARGLHPDNLDADGRLHLQILSARVRDMSVYNRYLPAQSALRVLGGQAELRADVHLTPGSAAGYVKLRTHRLLGRVNDQEIAGQLRVDVNLAGGAPQQMVFDISGSTLSLDHVQVAGRQREFDQTDWHARLDLHHGVALWSPPTRLSFDAGLIMSDTRPLAAIMANQRGKYGWLEKIFSVADVHALARATITPDQIVIAHLLAESDDMDVGAKGVIAASSRAGAIYLRYKRLHGLLKIEAGGRSFHLRQARKKFDAYLPKGRDLAPSIRKLSEL